MICPQCRPGGGGHNVCAGNKDKTWCDCQHHPEGSGINYDAIAKSRV